MLRKTNRSIISILRLKQELPRAADETRLTAANHDMDDLPSEGTFPLSARSQRE